MWRHHKKRGLRNWVLLLIGRGPKNGAELIEAMEAMTHGGWRPSPGSVYPLLEQMVAEKTLKRREDGRYELTADARDDPIWGWAPSPRTPGEVVRELTSMVAYLEDLATGPAAGIPEVRDDLTRLARRIEKVAAP